MNPQRKVSTAWSPELAYVVGLITTDGCLSKDGRHIEFTSKDVQLVKTFKKCLKINNKIGFKKGSFSDQKCPRIQFGDIVFYKWLLSIGVTPRKSKTIGSINIPNHYLFDFVRGHFDGDGYCYSYWDKRWNSSFMFYLVFTSASDKHIKWLQLTIKKLLGINGHINQSGLNKFNSNVIQLKYAKREARLLIAKMYYCRELPYLKRKKMKIEKILKIDDRENNKLARVAKLATALP